jgi:serpin B
MFALACAAASPATPMPTSEPTPSKVEEPFVDTRPSPTPRPGSGHFVELVSDIQRTAAPKTTAAEMATQVEGNSAFAIDLYQALKSEEGNLFYSPYSVSLALAMTYAGSGGETEEQMASTLHFVLPQDRLHANFNALDLELASRGEGARGKDGKGFRLNIVNAIWGQRDFEFHQGFLDLLAENYGAGMRLLDFVHSPEPSRTLINRWVSDQTEDRIEELIPQGFIDEDTRLILTNAIYFNAAWQFPFSEQATRGGTFHLLDGGEVTVPMMKETAGFGYAEGDGYQAVELPYDGDELSMVILLPDENEFEDLESSIDSEFLKSAVGGIKRSRLALTLPKFEIQSEFGLADRLADMGMPAAFSDGADFSGMSGAGDLFLTDVVHQAFITIDEAGTEAAAATAVGVGITSLPPELEINRPFVFLIRDTQTGAILFLGRVLNPAAET